MLFLYFHAIQSRFLLRYLRDSLFCNFSSSYCRVQPISDLGQDLLCYPLNEHLDRGIGSQCRLFETFLYMIAAGIKPILVSYSFMENCSTPNFPSHFEDLLQGERC